MNGRGCSALSAACWVLCNASVMFQICLIFMKIQTNFSPAIDRVACSKAVFKFIRVLFCYADNSSKLCKRKKTIVFVILNIVSLQSVGVWDVRKRC